MLAPGDTIDRYEVLELIGSGGTAVVYRVRHTALGTEHALKVLSVTSPVIRDRMLTEGRVQASLRHLNVVAVTDVLDVNGAPGLLMEHIEGPSLEKALEDFQIPLAAAESLFIGIVNGMRQAHHHDLVHRDLKPANVLLAATPDGFVPKVTDFGLAKVIAESGATGQGHTRAGVALGTPAYMAPEQIRDARRVDQRADVFALGCILYELVTKQRVYPGNDTIEIYNNVLDAEFAAPRDLVPDLPERIENAILGALVQDRNKRIPDCETLLAVLAGEQVWTIPPRVEGFRPQITEEHTLPEDLGPPPSAPVLTLAAAPPTPSDEASRSERAAPADDLDDVVNLPPPTPAPAASRAELPPTGLDAELPRPVVPPTVDAPERPAIPPTIDSPPAPLSTEELDALDAEYEPRRGGMLWVGIGVALLLLLLLVGGGGAVAWFGWSALNGDTASEPQLAVAEPEPVVEPAATEATPDSDTEAVPETEAAPAPEPAAPTPAPSPAPAPTPAPVRTIGSPTPSPAPVPTRQIGTRPAPAPVVAPAAVSVEVKLLSVPPTATLRVDGSTRGRTPSKLDLLTGRHQVALTSGDRTESFSIAPTEAGENIWCYSFDASRLYQGRCP